MSKYRVVVIWQLGKTGDIIPRCCHLKFGSFPKDWDSWEGHPLYSEIHNIYDQVPRELYEECACNLQPGPAYASVREGEGTFFAELIFELASLYVLEKKPVYVFMNREGQIVDLNSKKSCKMLSKECHVTVGMLVAGNPESVPVKWSRDVKPIQIIGDTKIYEYKYKPRKNREHVLTFDDYSGRWDRPPI